jgi:hypothetical protein
LSLQKALMSNFSFDLEGLTLISEAMSDECGRAMCRLTAKPLCRESWKGTMGNWPAYHRRYLNSFATFILLVDPSEQPSPTYYSAEVGWLPTSFECCCLIFSVISYLTFILLMLCSKI